MDSNHRINNAAPALPAASTALPALSPWMGPLSPNPVMGAGKKKVDKTEPGKASQKIENLEHRDLFFSRQSPRSYVERYLGDKNSHRLSFRFEREASKSGLRRFLEHSQAVLLVEKTPVSARSEKSATPLRATAQKERASVPAKKERLSIELLEYEEINRSPLLQKALLSVSATPYKIQRFAYVPKTGELHPEAAFKRQGIQKVEHEGWHKLMGWMRQVLPYAEKSRLPLGVDEDLALRVGSRLRFQPGHAWRDEAGNAVEMLDLMRLDAARMVQVVQVRDRRVVEKTEPFSLHRPDSRKSWKDRILQEIDAIEQRGYFLQSGQTRLSRHVQKKTAASQPALPTRRPDASTPLPVKTDVLGKSKTESRQGAKVNFSGAFQKALKQTQTEEKGKAPAERLSADDPFRPENPFLLEPKPLDRK